MSDELEDQYEVADQEQDSSVIRDLRRKAKEADSLKARVAELEAEQARSERSRRLVQAVSSVGVAATDQERFLKLADKFIEGEPDEAALRDLAKEYNFLTEPTQAQAQATALAEVASLHRDSQTLVTGTPEHAAAELRDLSQRVMLGQVSQADVMRAIQAAGLRTDNSSLEISGVGPVTVA